MEHRLPRDWEQRRRPTGLHDYFPPDDVTEEGYFDARSTAMGVGAEGIEVVVLSHLHFDHAGNGRMFDTTSATMVRHEREREFALGIDGPCSGAHLQADYEGLELAEFRASVEKPRGIQHRTGATVVFGHDAEQILRLRTAPGASYT